MATIYDEDDILKCGICCNRLTIPKQLPCLHLFCKNCLINKETSTGGNESEQAGEEHGNYDCPVCSSNVSVPKGVNISTYISNLPTNRFIEALLSRASIAVEGTLCGSCLNDGEDKNAVIWCHDCNEGLCDQCHIFHKKSKLSHSYKVSDIRDAKQQSIRISVSRQCTSHPKRELDAYCHDHQQPCCNACVTTHHRKCDHVTTLEEAARQIHESTEITEILKIIQDAEEITADYFLVKTAELEQLEIDRQNIIKQIRSLRREINTHLDQLETKIIQELSILHNNISKEIENQRKQSSNTKSIVTNCKRLLSTLLEKSSEENLFLEKNSVSEKIREQLEIISAMTSDPKKSRYEVSLTPELVNFASSIETFGALQCFKLSPVQHNVGAFQNILNVLPSVSKNCKIEELKIFKTDKCNTNYLHGVSLLPDGSILLTNAGDKCLCRFDSNGEFQEEVKLPGSPFDVAMVSGNEASVSYYKNGISVVDIDRMSIKQSNILKPHTQAKVCGITAIDENIIAACDDRILILDTNGSVINEIRTPEPRCTVRYITAVSRTRLCYSNPHHHSVVCINMDGTEVFTYTHDNLEWPFGVTQDNEGVIYVAGYGSSNVHQISREGQLIQIFLKSDHGIQKPYAINFDRQNNKLVLTHSGSKVTTCKISKA